MKHTILAAAVASLILTGCGSDTEGGDRLVPVSETTDVPDVSQGVDLGGRLGDVAEDA